MSRRGAVRALRRPLALAAVAAAILTVHPLLVRAMAHGHVAHVLLGSGNAAPPAGAALLAIALVVVRFVAIVFVPGLVLAGAAELVAYLLVGPKRTPPSGGPDQGGGSTSISS